MARRRLFLLGGSGALGLVAQALARTISPGSTVALLVQSREGWEKHGAEYAEPLRLAGISQYSVIVPRHGGMLDVAEASATLAEAATILIGGGHTPTYHRLYAAEPIRSVIRERYSAGVPVVGVSAGALVTPAICILGDETSPIALQAVEGLGLIDGALMSVHFTERKGLAELIEQMAATRTALAWGIDESACAVFEDEDFKGALGRSVYKITMRQFDIRSYDMVQCPMAELA